MRIATFNFDPADDAIAYPGGIALWGNTVTIGNQVVGEYLGDDAAIEDYSGTWPVPEYLETFDSKQLLAALTDTFSSDQAITALQVPAIQAQLELLRIRTRTISIADAGYQSAIDGLVAASALTVEQGDEFKTSGIRITD